MKEQLKLAVDLVRDTAHNYAQDKGPMLAASLAYYTIFSLAPLIVLTVALASFFVGEQAVAGKLVLQIDDVVGADAAIVIEDLIKNASQATSSLTATIISTILLIVGASGVFAQLKRAINSVWGIAQPPNRGFLIFLQTRLFAFIMVLGVGFLLVLSMATSTILGLVSEWLTETGPLLANVLPIVDLFLTFAVMTLCFALIFKFLPDAEVSWQDVGLGALVTAVLLGLGENLITWYLATWTGGAAYGAAGWLILLLLWVYLSAQIFLFGAEFTQTYANKYGSRLIPDVGVLQVMHQRYEPVVPKPEPMSLPLEETGIVDSPPRQQQKHIAFGLIGLALGLFLGFIGYLWRD